MSGERTHEYTPGLHGWITHTELSSDDPKATRNWCTDVFGWTFQPAFPTPAGEYHLFAYSEQGGGGIRQTASGEAPGAMPTVHVDDTDEAFQAALAAGAEPVGEPHDIMAGCASRWFVRPAACPSGCPGRRPDDGPKARPGYRTHSSAAVSASVRDAALHARRTEEWGLGERR